MKKKNLKPATNEYCVNNQEFSLSLFSHHYVILYFIVFVQEKDTDKKK